MATTTSVGTSPRTTAATPFSAPVETSVTVPTTATATPAGVASTPSTITSAAPAPAESSKGFCAQISDFVARVIDSICNFLGKIPSTIGSWFTKSASTASTNQNTTTSTTTSAPAASWTDQERVEMIRQMFVPVPETTTAGDTAVAVPAQDMVEYALELFRGIQSPIEKMMVFNAVLTANNSTDAIARQFYDALPPGTAGHLEASQTSFRECIWHANGNSSMHDRIEYGMRFGEHIIDTAIRGPLAQGAADDLLHVLFAAEEHSLTPAPAGTGTPEPAVEELRGRVIHALTAAGGVVAEPEEAPAEPVATETLAIV